METHKVEISLRTLLYVLGTVLGLWLLWELRGVLIILFVSFTLMSSLVSTVEWFQRQRVPRVLAVIIPFVLFFLLVGLLLSFIISPVINESAQLIQQLSNSYNDLQVLLQSFSGQNIQLPLDSLNSIPVRAVQVGIGTFNAFLGIVSIAVITFYMLLERDRLYDSFLVVFPSHKRDGIRGLFRRIEDRLGNWVRGEFILMLAVGVFTFLGLSLLGVRYALALAIIAGILEIVPIIGPIVSAIPAVIVALTVSPLLAVFTAVLYVVIQQLENHLLVPNIMRKSVNLDALAVIIALMVGGRLMGIWGSLLAVPLLAAAQIVITYLSSEEHR